MKTITIDFKSFCLGGLAVGALLVLFNFKPADKPELPDTYRRYQVVTAENTRTVIIDTQTGRFLIERPGIGVPGWLPSDFEELFTQKKK